MIPYFERRQIALPGGVSLAAFGTLVALGVFAGVRPHAPWIHLALAQLRAVEQRRYLVRATNTGVSAVIDPLGRVIARSGSFTRETLDVEVAMLAGSTPYQTLGDWPGVLALAALLWLAVRRR